MKLVLLMACVGSLTLAAAGCGGGDESRSTDEWAQGFCSATAAWNDDIRRITGEVRDQPPESVAAVEEAVSEARAAIDVYVGELRQLGAPDTESSEQIESAIAELADEVESEMAEIEDTVDDAAGLAGLATAARDIAISVTAMFTALQQTYETFESADVDRELEQAFEDADGCDELGA